MIGTRGERSGFRSGSHIGTRLTVVVVSTAILPLGVVALMLLGSNDALSPGTVAGIAVAVVTLGLIAAGILGILVERWVVVPYEEAAEQVHFVQREFRRSVERIGSLLGATHDRASIIEVLLETAAVTAGADGAVFWEWHGGRLTAAAARGHASIGPELQRGEGLAGLAAAEGSEQRHPPVELAEVEPGVRAALAVPVQGPGRLFGVLALYGHQGVGPYDDDDASTVAALANQAEAAIVNTFLHEEAKSLSITDGLTGLWNRRQFDFSCSTEIERAARFGESFAVVMIDIDHFKQINDVHGHLAGDAALVELARRLSESTREVDVVARYGGEEFVLLLPRTDRPGGVKVAEKLGEAVRSEPFEVQAGSLDLTVSLGVAAYPHDGTTPRMLVKAADEALYEAKRSGRNRVVAAPALRRSEEGVVHPADQ